MKSFSPWRKHGNHPLIREMRISNSTNVLQAKQQPSGSRVTQCPSRGTSRDGISRETPPAEVFPEPRLS